MRPFLTAGSAAWLLRHELHLFLRHTLLARSDKSAKFNLSKSILVWGVLALALHGIAFAFLWHSRGEAAEPPHMVVMLVTGAMLAVLTLMLSTGLRASVEALFERGDLDLLLSSPLSSRSIFTVRLGAVVIGSAGLYLFFLAPLAHAGLVLGQFRWLAIYPTLIGMAVLTSSTAMLLTLALVRLIGVRRTRVAAQLLSALSGAALFLASQANALRGVTGDLPGRLAPLLKPGALLGPDSLVWLPAQTVLGGAHGMLIVGALSALLFTLTVRYTHGFFVHGVQQAVSRVEAAPPPAGAASLHFGRSLGWSIMIKEWRLIARDPQLISQVLLQLLYMLPLLVLVFSNKVASLGGLAAALTFLCSSLTGSLAWIIIAAEDAPDLLRASPCDTDVLKLAKLGAAVLPVLALVLVPLAWMATRSPLAAAAMLLMAAIGCANSALVVKWCSRPAARGDFRRRGKGNVTATLFEVIGGVLWSAAAFTLVSATAGTRLWGWMLVGAAVAAVIAMVALGLARHFRPADE